MHLRTLVILLFIIFLAPFLAACSPVPPNNGLGDESYLENYQYAGNIWRPLGNSFTLPSDTTEITQVREQINWLVSNPSYLRQIAKQAQPYLYYVFQQVKARNLPGELVLLPMVESAYDPFAHSHMGASGLWQMMPGTASGFGLKVNWWYDGRRDLIASTNAALNYLEYLVNFFDGDWLLAIAAYDSGEGTVQNAIKRNLKAGKNTDFWSLPLPTETQTYLPRLLALATIIKYYYEYPVDLPIIKNSPYLTSIDVGSQIDISQAAKMANIEVKDFMNLNPGFNRWATDPDGPHEIILPINKVNDFKTKLTKLPKEKRVTWLRYRVQKGNTLSDIAKKHNTNIIILREVNHLKDNTIRSNQVLLIPTSTKDFIKGILHAPSPYLIAARRIPEVKITNHLVKHGDTFSEIAKKYRVTDQQIRFWNGMKYRDKLKPDQKLILWPSRNNLRRAVGTTWYIVKTGNSLGSIAQKYNTSTKELKKLNKLKTNNIYIGKRLQVPSKPNHNSSASKLKKSTIQRSTSKITYLVKAKDTLSNIAKKYNVKTTELKSWNSIQNSNKLKPKQLLVMYK